MDNPPQFSTTPRLDAPAQAPSSVSIATEHDGLERRMKRLVDALLEGRVIPFLGAGISQQAKQKSADSASKLSLNAGVLAQRLAEKLRNKVFDGDRDHPPARSKLIQLALKTAGHDDDGQPLCDWSHLNDLPLDTARLRYFVQALDDTDSQRADIAPSPRVKLRAFAPTLGEVAEFCWSILGPAKTCEALALEKWHAFQPTAAHHFLAVLVREGLITEILETNYDELVEGAVRETFGDDGPRPAKEELHKAVAVIRDLVSYRDQIAKPRRPAKHEALVKLIKLNGCAKAYRDGTKGFPPSEKRDRAAKGIILTEEQLQSWGDKVWARELLSDRVRSRSLLFIGFGNQDPIVRHHAIAVIREFGTYTTSALPPVQLDAQNQERNSRWYERPNAPFVAAYGPNLTFYQLQLLRAFRDAHIPPGRRDDAASLSGLAETYHNTFLGDDGPGLNKEHNKDNLPADLLLRRVAGQALCRHIPTEYLKRDSAVERHLHGALRDPKALLMTVARLVFAGTVKSPALFEKWMALKAGTTGDADQESSAWATVCFAILGKSKSPGRGGYVPFSDEPIRLPMLLALLVIAASLGADSRSLPDADELRLRCGAADGGDKSINGYRLLDRNGRRWPVYATQNLDRFLRQWGTMSPRSAGAPALDQAVVVLLGRGLVRAFRKRRWIPPDGTDERFLREVIVMGDLTALRGHSREPVHLPTAAKNLASVARAPEQMLGLREHWRDYCIEE